MRFFLFLQDICGPITATGNITNEEKEKYRESALLKLCLFFLSSLCDKMYSQWLILNLVVLGHEILIININKKRIPAGLQSDKHEQKFEIALQEG